MEKTITKQLYKITKTTKDNVVSVSSTQTLASSEQEALDKVTSTICNNYTSIDIGVCSMNTGDILSREESYKVELVK